MMRGLIKGWFKHQEDSSPILSGEVAWSESSIYGAKDFPKYNPDALIGAKGHHIYKRMMLDEQVKAVVNFKRDAITARKHFFELETDKLPDKEIDRRIKLFNLIVDEFPGSFQDGLNGIMSAMYTGFSLSEKVYRQKELTELDGLTWIILEALKLKPFDTFHFYVDVHGNIEKVTQRMGFEEQDIDLSRFVHYVQQPDIDPHYGQSELREAYRPWFSKDHIIKFRNIFLERMAGGLAWIEVESGVTITKGSQTHTDLMNVLNHFQTKNGILLPTGVKLNVMFPTGKNDNYEASISSDNLAIAKALLVPNLLGVSEQSKVGALAQSQTQLEAFLWTLDRHANRLEETMNEQVFRELGDMNFGDGIYPKYKLKPISESLKHQIITKWNELVGSKAVTVTDTDEDHLRELLGFPEKGEPRLPPQPVVPPVPGQGAGGVPNAPRQPADEDSQTLEETLMGAQLALVMERALKRVDFAVIDQKSTSLESRALDVLTPIMQRLGKDFVEAVESLNRLTPDAVDAIKIKSSLKAKLRNKITVFLKEAWTLGQQHAQRELEKVLVGQVPEIKQLQRILFQARALTEEAAELFMENRSFQIAGDITAGARKKIVTILFNGIKNSWALPEIVQRIEEEIAASVIPQLSTVVRTTVFESMNEARYNFFSAPELGGFVEAMQYSAILDGRTTPICRELDGRIFPLSSDEWQTYRPPNHFNCRSLLIAITQRDTWKESDPAELLPAPGFG